MKKILLGTTTLIGAAALFSGAAFADTPKVTIGGYENFEMGIDRDDMNSKETNGEAVSERPDAFRSDTQIDFKIDGKSDAGLGYGGEVDLLADTSPDVQGRGTNASKTFIYMDGMWGRAELGSNVGADGTMKVDAGTIARATGGIDGDWNYFADAKTQFLAQSELPLSYGVTGLLSAATGVLDNFTGDHTDENIDKVTYYTPRFAGFQVGVSFMPDQVNRGQGYGPVVTVEPNGPDRSKGLPGLSEDIITGGINYDNKFGDVGLAIAATGEHGTAESSLYEDLNAWNAGGKLSWMGWSLAGSYGSWGDSNDAKANHAGSSTYWDAGGAYEYGPFGVSLTYLHSTLACGISTGTLGDGANSSCLTAGDDGFHNVSLGADYKLAPGLTPYVEVSAFKESTISAADDDKGYVGIIGTQLNF
jgi:predicted porin